MLTVLVALGSFILYVVAYHTYGKWVSRRIFGIDPQRLAPSREINDGIDFVPSRKELVFGHHFTSIAGTGPIVGPAIAVVWGWVPALVWVLVGSIVMGAVHDLGSLIVSMRHRGRTIADLAGSVVNRRVRILFMLVVVVGLWIVLAVFGLVIAAIFSLYPSSVAPVFCQIPIAIGLGLYLRRGGNLLGGTVVAVGLMYATIAWSASIDWQANPLLPPGLTEVIGPVAFWTLVLLGYVSIASVLPVQWLLQPRDYINTHQLLIAMALLVVGLLASRPDLVADAVNARPAAGDGGAIAPPMLPFLFVTIACGAISGFHCLVSSGCSSRQLTSEADATYVGFGAMLTEGFLAVLVILVCCAGIGLGTLAGDTVLTGREAWLHHYHGWGGDAGLASVLAPFIGGAANMIETIGLDRSLAIAIMGVFVASFAATTLDSATRLQRYVISELIAGDRPADSRGPIVRVLASRYGATALAVVSAGALALSDAWTVGLHSAGKGGLTLWPIFGATNQLLGGLALLVVTVWLVRQRRPVWVTAVPMVFMLAMTGWAIASLIGQFASRDGSLHLLIIAGMMLALEIWIVIEAIALACGRRGSQGPEGSDG